MSAGPLWRVPGPFRLAIADQAFPDEVLHRLEALFEAPQDWVRHQDTFYRCDIARVDGQLDEAFLRGLQRDVGEALGLPLAGPVHVTAQRMHPTDGSDRHTDHPKAGYEAARLVVQLDQGVGGHFRAFDGDTCWLDRPPHRGGAVAFELGPDSWHDVTACTGTRRTVVFHLWHLGNPPDARERLDRELAGLSFAELPAALHPVMDAAEALYDDERTFRAGSVATLLARWGRTDEELVGAYQRVLAGAELPPVEAVADWVVGLHVDGFDRRDWERLLRRLGAR